MIEKLDFQLISEIGVFGGAFFLLFKYFIHHIERESERSEKRDVMYENRISSLIKEHKDDMTQIRNVFISSIHEVTNKLITIDVKLTEHMKENIDGK